MAVEHLLAFHSPSKPEGILYHTPCAGGKMLAQLLDDFKKEKTYINGVAPKTIDWYEKSFSAYKQVVGDVEIPTKQILIRFVIGLREVDTRCITTCNNYIRGMNSFLTWRYENEHTKEKHRIKLLKDEGNVLYGYRFLFQS